MAGCRVTYNLQVLEDTELYQVQRPDASHAALKIARAAAPPTTHRMLAREAGILRRLDNAVNPALFESGRHGEQPYLLMSWCGGIDAMSAAAERRGMGGRAGQRGLVELCAAILDAYGHLHAQHVIHGDVHPHNVLVDVEGTVRIVDYGLARLDGPERALNRAPRGGVGFFFDPEYARAALAQRRPPQADELSEQYALAAMLYHLVTGAHYLDFSLEREAMLRQIVDEPPLPFSHWDAAPGPEVERAVLKALSKAPEERFTSTVAFARAFREAARRDEASAGERGAGERAQTERAADKLLQDVLLEVSPESPLFASALPQAPTCSVMAGAAGIAYALYRIACARRSPRLLAWADLWIAWALRERGSDEAFASESLEVTPETVGRVSPYHTLSGVHAVQAMIAHVRGDRPLQQAAIEAFAEASRAPCDALDLTLAASLLLDTVTGREGVEDGSLRALGDEVAAEIWTRLDALPPIAEAAELSNLGIAHGWAGLLYATLRWRRSSGGDLPDAIEERLAQLGELAEPIGRGARWKWMLERPAPGSAYPYMPGWCNGSAGYVHLWTLAYRTFHDETYLRLARWAAWNAWEDPAAAGSLCCGLAGRAYALLNLFKQTGETAWLERARTLADRAAEVGPTPDLPAYSLYKGTLGMAVLAADLKHPSGAAMPFFEEEGWV